MNKNKKLIQQQRRLAGNVHQAKADKEDLKSQRHSSKNHRAPNRSGAKKAGGILSSLKTRVFGTATPPQTVQQSIPYREIYKDGICRVTDHYFSKTIEFDDINYQLAQNEDKSQIFEHYCDFLNYFDSTIHLQLSCVNRRGNVQEFQRSIEIADQNDGHDQDRREYSEMLRGQLAKGNNGLSRKKYITFGIEAKSLRDAKLRLERIETDILNNFKVMGVKARSLNGAQRLEILHGQFHPDGREKLRFDWSEIPKTGLSTKDFIAPASFDFSNGRIFRLGGQVGAASFLQIIAPELTDRMLADFLDMDSAVTVNLHIRSIDQTAAIKAIKRKLSDIDKMKIEEQKKAVRAGYDMLRPDRV